MTRYYLFYKKRSKIPIGYSEAVNQKRSDNTMAKGKRSDNTMAKGKRNKDN
jgi:hypothetical protein